MQTSQSSERGSGVAAALRLMVILIVGLAALAAQPAAAREEARPTKTGLAPAAPAATFAPLKVSVDMDGIVQVRADDLDGQGWNLAELDPATIKLTRLGSEVPIEVVGQDTSAFQAGGLVIFYGQAMTGPYTRRNVYWLTAGGADGLRMEARNAAPTHGYAKAASFPATLHAEQDLPAGYWQNPPGKEAQDHWYWTAPLAAPTGTQALAAAAWPQRAAVLEEPEAVQAPAVLSFPMPAFDPAGPPGGVVLRVRLAGKTDDTAVSPDHHSRIRLNGTVVSDAWWDGQTEFTQTKTVDPALLLAGANTVTVELPGDTGASVDTVYPNWLEVDYTALYASQGDALAFSAPGAGNTRFEVSGFSSGEIDAFDLTNTAAPVRLLNVESQAAGGGTTTAVLEDAAAAGSRYLVQAQWQRLMPDELIADTPSDLRNPANGADEIILTYDGFTTAAQSLASYRQGQGMRVQVVRLSDVYDEFSGGLATPEAIRDFLAYAYAQWARPRPAYVLLIGDANLDYLDRFGTAGPNFMPTHIFDATEIGQTADDSWLAEVAWNDPLPDFYLGRLPARSADELLAMIAKIKTYEAAPYEEWQDGVLFVADDVARHEQVSETWANAVPQGYATQRIYASAYPPGNMTDDLKTAFNSGELLVTYIGHGNLDRWGVWSGGRIFDAAGIKTLSNSARLPFVLTANCLNGFFVHPYTDDSMAELFARKADGGAIAAWSPTALGTPAYQETLFGALQDELLSGAPPTLGEATTRAKQRAYQEYVPDEDIAVLTLFGDPAVRLHRQWTSRSYLPLVASGMAH